MDDVVELPMFPLGSVLFPAMPLPLRVFEDRYLQMLRDVFEEEPAEFGVVLIERGHEVGGGEHRFDVGTVAQVVELAPGDGFVAVVAEGRRRFEVVEWLPEDPYPRALVHLLPPLGWDAAESDRRDQTEALVRRTLARASEFDDLTWSPTVQLSDDPAEALWQLAAIAPLGPLDQMGLLRWTTPRELLDAVFAATQDVGELLDARGA